MNSYLIRLTKYGLIIGSIILTVIVGVGVVLPAIYALNNSLVILLMTLALMAIAAVVGLLAYCLDMIIKSEIDQSDHKDLGI